MLSDGMIGNYRILETLGNLTAGVYNYFRSSGAKAYTLEDILPTAYDYLRPPMSEQDKKELASQKLLSFMMMYPNAPKALTGEQNG